MKPYPKALKQNARRLRSQMTEAEQALWSRLRRKQLHGLQFYRQKPVGSYIVDFYCAGAKLVIEVDGGQHFTEDGRNRDMVRDELMSKMGLRVLRFDNGEVMRNMDGVMAMIETTVLESPHAPLLQRGDM
ncbi:MAG: endonuclease domain-containing protein [Mariprofundaceae bacterium]|nr:endonuclease domain-containing protein [Mariprofundaceae bacterium]